MAEVPMNVVNMANKTLMQNMLQAYEKASSKFSDPAEVENGSEFITVTATTEAL